jgi:HEAT repeat protein
MRTQTKTLLAAVAVSLLAHGAHIDTADAGRGGSAARIRNAEQSGSVDAILAEVERTERLVCGGCIDVVMDLLDHDRYEVREVAAWWFAKRPALADQIKARSYDDLRGSDGRLVRNAADFLGNQRGHDSVAALAAAATRPDLSPEARRSVVRALGTIAHSSANPALTAAMADSDAGVRAAALDGWLRILGQRGAAPAVALVTDGDAGVRARAAAVIGNLREAGGRAALESVVATDSDPVVRRNAAWALGRIGNAGSRSVLDAASRDSSPLVRATAKAALRGLR